MAASTFTGSLAFWFRGQAVDAGGAASGGLTYWFRGQAYARNTGAGGATILVSQWLPTYPSLFPWAKGQAATTVVLAGASGGAPPVLPIEKFNWRGVFPDRAPGRDPAPFPSAMVDVFYDVDVRQYQWRGVYPSWIDRRELHPATLGTYTTGYLFATVRESQTPIELAAQDPPGELRESQTAIELAWVYPSAWRRARVSQVAIEIIYPFGCYLPPTPIAACPAPDPDDAASTDTCTTPNRVS